MNEYTMIQRAAAQLRAWHTKYGEYTPGWLPPAGDVKWLEDAEAYLAVGPVVTKTYPDGTTATGPAPLPEQSPADGVVEAGHQTFAPSASDGFSGIRGDEPK